MKSLFRRVFAPLGSRPPREQISRAAYQVSPDVKASEHAEGVIFLHARKGLLFSSNQIGARIFAGIAGGEYIGSIATRISRECDVPAAQVEQDAFGFLAELEAHGIVTRKLGY